jgi:hypothetical protein
MMTVAHDKALEFGNLEAFAHRPCEALQTSLLRFCTSVSRKLEPSFCVLLYLSASFIHTGRLICQPLPHGANEGRAAAAVVAAHGHTGVFRAANSRPCRVLAADWPRFCLISTAFCTLAYAKDGGEQPFAHILLDSRFTLHSQGNGECRDIDLWAEVGLLLTLGICLEQSYETTFAAVCVRSVSACFARSAMSRKRKGDGPVDSSSKRAKLESKSAESAPDSPEPTKSAAASSSDGEPRWKDVCDPILKFIEQSDVLWPPGSEYVAKSRRV